MRDKHIHISAVARGWLSGPGRPGCGPPAGRPPSGARTRSTVLLHSEPRHQTRITQAVLRIRIRRIHMFLGLPDPNPLVRDTDTNQDLDPSIIKQK